jgi:hypothetical protein
LDTAEAFGQWGKYERALDALWAANEVAPEEVRTRRSVRTLIGDLGVRGPRSVQIGVRTFAEGIGVDA